MDIVFLPNIKQSHMSGMIDLIWKFLFAADAWSGNIQNEMDASYLEQSSLTNLFTEHKFWGWAGLLSIFLAIAAILYFQFQAWEQEDQEQEIMSKYEREARKASSYLLRDFNKKVKVPGNDNTQNSLYSSRHISTQNEEKGAEAIVTKNEEEIRNAMKKERS